MKRGGEKRKFDAENKFIRFGDGRSGYIPGTHINGGNRVRFRF